MRRVALIATLAGLLLLAGTRPAPAVTGPGDYFPAYRFQADLNAGQAAYLGLPGGAGPHQFTAAEIGAELLVLELFNSSCQGCQKQAPLMSRVHKLIGQDPSLAARVRFVGLGLGNDARVVEEFRRRYDIPFPLVPDPDFGVLDVIGDPGGTPFTFILRRMPGGMLVLRAHLGTMASPEETLGEIRKAAAVDPGLVTTPPGEPATPRGPGLEVPLSEGELLRNVKESMARGGFPDAVVTRVMAGNEPVFLGAGRQGKVFTKVVSRLPVCDVCHPIHFIISVDAAGKVVDFDAIAVTKYGNALWSPAETAAMRSKLVGLSVLEKHPFDPRVDAVTSATMSSSLIYNSLGKVGRLLETLRQDHRL